MCLTLCCGIALTCRHTLITGPPTVPRLRCWRGPFCLPLLYLETWCWTPTVHAVQQAYLQPCFGHSREGKIQKKCIKHLKHILQWSCFLPSLFILEGSLAWNLVSQIVNLCCGFSWLTAPGTQWRALDSVDPRQRACSKWSCFVSRQEGPNTASSVQP